ncbi:MAG: hypothetical protein ABW277_20760 [Longimicrobiaceae bacterium]
MRLLDDRQQVSQRADRETVISVAHQHEREVVHEVRNEGMVYGIVVECFSQMPDGGLEHSGLRRQSEERVVCLGGHPAPSRVESPSRDPFEDDPGFFELSNVLHQVSVAEQRLDDLLTVPGADGQAKCTLIPARCAPEAGDLSTQPRCVGSQLRGIWIDAGGGLGEERCGR